MKILLVLLLLGFVSAQCFCADTKTLAPDSPEANECLAMIAEYHLAKQPVPLIYKSVAIQMMLREANRIAEKLKLPASRPIQLTDVQPFYSRVSAPWFSMLKETSRPFLPITVFSNRIFDISIPREQRARAFKICLSGVIQTTNLLFSFDYGRLTTVQRMSGDFQYYSTNLDQLIGKSSLINDVQAHEMATRWLAAVDIDVAALEKKYPPEVNHMRFMPENSTNAVELPIYFVTWGWIGAPISSEPLAEVKILGTTKELVDLRVWNLLRFSDTSFSTRPPLLITNAIDLLGMGNPPAKHLNVNTSEVKQIPNAQQSP